MVQPEVFCDLVGVMASTSKCCIKPKIPHCSFEVWLLWLLILLWHSGGCAQLQWFRAVPQEEEGKARRLV